MGSLVSLKADLERGSRNDLTPLHYACSFGKLSIVELLLNARSNIEAEAIYNGIPKRRPLHIAAREGQVEIITMLALRRADVHVHAADGTTPLFLAAGSGQASAVAALLTARAQVDVVQSDKFKRTALMRVAKQGNVAVVALLLSAKSNPAIKDANNRNSMDFCRECPNAENANIIESLLDAALGQLGQQRPESRGQPVKRRSCSALAVEDIRRLSIDRINPALPVQPYSQPLQAERGPMDSVCSSTILDTVEEDGNEDGK